MHAVVLTLCLLPPVQYQGLPPEPRANPVYHLVPSQDVDWDCREDLGLESIRPVVACSGWKDGHLQVYIAKDVPTADQQCSARHELGHETMRELTGDADYWHAGWTLQ